MASKYHWPTHYQHWPLQLVQSIPRIAGIVFGTSIPIEELEHSRLTCDIAPLDAVPVCLCGITADGVVGEG